MRNKKFATAVLVALIVIAGIVVALVSASRKQEVSADEPRDLVHEFYKLWLGAAQSPTTDPYQEGLDEWPFLGRDLREKIRDARGDADAIDPVLCQTFVPEEVAQRRVSEAETESEFVVTARRSSSTQQAIVTVLALDGGWYIGDVECSPGEFAPDDREFTFDREGTLSKNPPAPLKAGEWHLVFEENGQSGQYVPLFFDAESTCSTGGGAAGACSPDTFAEGAKAHVQGELLERGLDVKRLELGR